MGGGLMQLVAYGAQDIYLTGNPQITFFKVVYRRHTNFAVESIEQTFNGQADFGKRVTATISRNGDLIQQMYLEVILPIVTPAFDNDVAPPSDVAVWTYGVGNALVKQVEIEIGGQLIDRQYGDWMNIWSELTIPAGKRDGYDVMVGNIPYNQENNNSTPWSRNNQIGGLYANPPNNQNPFNTNGQGKCLYIPLQFWFNRNPGLALPLIALQYHEVKLNLELRNFIDLIQVESAVTPVQTQGLSCKLYVDYVYLDTDERRRFAQVSHEYLIEQVQFTGTESISKNTSIKNLTLNFNHPVKELIWVHTTGAHTTSSTNFLSEEPIAPGNCWFNYSGADTSIADVVPSVDSFQTGVLQLNGHDRFSLRRSDYFRKVQNYEHHTRCPRVGCELGGTLETNNQEQNTFSFMNDRRMQYIYTYSFALSPEEHQPSGTCNFSRIDNAILQLTYDSTVQTALVNDNLNLNVYAVNYNVLRIMSGMGGLAYSN